MPKTLDRHLPQRQRTEGRQGTRRGHLLLVGLGVVVDEAKPAVGEDLEADVAALLGPFVVLFGEDCDDEADEGGPVGEDADDVGAAADLAVAWS